MVGAPGGQSDRGDNFAGSGGLGVALAQKSYDTGESSERCVLQELLSSLELEGVLIQADALHTTRPFFSGAWSRGPTCS
jgi:hypothetical protein